MMTKNYTFAPIVLLIVLIVSLIGGKLSAQNTQKKVNVTKVITDGETSDADKAHEKVIVKNFEFTSFGDSTDVINMDSLIQIHCSGNFTTSDSIFKIIKIINGDTIISGNWTDSIHHVFNENFNSDSIQMMIKKFGEEFEFTTDFDFHMNLDSLLDPLNKMDIDVSDFIFVNEDGEHSKNIEVIVNSGANKGHGMIIITDDGENIKIEREGEMVFINKDNNVKDVESNIEVIEDENGKVIVLQTRIVLDELTKEEQKELKAQGLKTSKKEPAFEYLKFYPNPTYGEFNIQFLLAKKSDIEVKISNMLGQVVFNEKLKGFEGEYRKAVNLKPNGKGNYVLQIIQGDRIISRKIIVE
ncbi:MAG: T9SS type A sorting domain-containing protein [Salinivirgaceae bacterium]|nr:T9SS type A sorting domain-containing protein [Salinivirgaceae bacterium]